MGYFTNLRRELTEYLKPEHVESVEKAYLIARDAHRGQKRLSGESYITHPVAAALILAKMRMDYQSIAATLLHDVIEDTSISKEQLAEKFGKEIAELVDGVSKLKQISFESRAEAQAEYFRKMVMAMVQDIRVIIVKLADRLHNMRTIQYMPRDSQKRIALETLEVYAPIANRIGMHSFYVELDDLGFRTRYPVRYRVLNDAVKTALGNRKVIISTIEKNFEEAVQARHLENYTISGRQKHIYSIYKKMRNKSASFAEIMDVYGFRIVVDDVDSCYRVLGAVHNLYKPRPERFKDYIALPKANGYQSLHTTLFGPYGVPIEVQIRTKDMDTVAANGIAAHWMYKAAEKKAGDAHERAREWVQSLLDLQKSSGSSIEFFESAKIDLFPDEVYVFTPTGHIMELPRGATPVDLAYAIHSDLGSTCVAAKVDRRLAPLSAALMNGQTVEIITANGASPNPAWLNFVVTGKARSNIRHYLKTQQHAESAKLGERLLEQALSDLSSSLDGILEEQRLTVAEALQYKSFDDLCAAIGLGNQVAMVIAKRMLQTDVDGDELKDISSTQGEHPLYIKGTEGMALHFAECCCPIPGDPIVGILQAGRGMMVHVENCSNVSYFRDKPERFITIRWEEDTEGEFKVDIMVEVANQRGVLAMLASTIADADANIDNISVDPRDGRYNIVSLTLTVRHRKHLAYIMRRIRQFKAVIRLQRKR